MIVEWKTGAATFLLLIVTAIFGGGCSGIDMSRSVSPATFLLPALMKADPPTPNGVQSNITLRTEASVQTAIQAN